MIVGPVTIHSFLVRVSLVYSCGGFIFQMIENQEELRASQEKIRVLQDEINVLRIQKAELEGRQSNGTDAEITLQLQELQNQARLHFMHKEYTE